MSDLKPTAEEFENDLRRLGKKDERLDRIALALKECQCRDWQNLRGSESPVEATQAEETMTARISIKEAKRLGLAPKRHKYRAVATVVDGVRFASKREARRYGELSLLRAAGKICDMCLQPMFRIEVNGEYICHYKADFAYVDAATSVRVVEDVKGFRTPVYRLKKKLVEALYGIKIVEV